MLSNTTTPIEIPTRLLTWGGDPEPGKPPDDDERARTHIDEIVYLDAEELTAARLGGLEENVLQVFV
jgi:hypothetical protein